jgi:hypothetical protein
MLLLLLPGLCPCHGSHLVCCKARTWRQQQQQQSNSEKRWL